MMKTWNLSLVVITFFLTIFGTFMTRSGVVQSVHAFGEDNVLALQFIVFMAVILVVSVGLIVYRSNKLVDARSSSTRSTRASSRSCSTTGSSSRARSSCCSRRCSRRSPRRSTARASRSAPEFFNKWMTPFGLILLFLAGAAPLLAWRKTTRERLWQPVHDPDRR